MIPHTGHCLRASARPCGRCCPSGSATAASAGLRDAAGRGPLPRLGAHDVPDPRRTAECASAATSSCIPAYAKPELLATAPNQVWSWDITKLLGPAKWTYYYLYVILDIFSRYVVGWTVPHRESAELAKG